MPCLSNVSSNSTFTFYLQSILDCRLSLSTSSNVGGWTNVEKKFETKQDPSYAPTPIINLTNASISLSSPETKHDPSSAPTLQIADIIVNNSNPTPTTWIERNWIYVAGSITIIISGYACLCNSGGCCRKSGLRKIIKSLRKRFRKVRKMSF